MQFAHTDSPDLHMGYNFQYLTDKALSALEHLLITAYACFQLEE